MNEPLLDYRTLTREYVNSQQASGRICSTPGSSDIG